MPPLDGLKVIDLTRVLAGPFCTMLLGDMGADVVKIEEPGSGDDTRGWAPFMAGGQSSYVLGENFRPGTLDRLGVGCAALSALNPRLIVASVTGYGQTGPRRELAGYD